MFTMMVGTSSGGTATTSMQSVRSIPRRIGVYVSQSRSRRSCPSIEYSSSMCFLSSSTRRKMRSPSRKSLGEGPESKRGGRWHCSSMQKYNHHTKVFVYKCNVQSSSRYRTGNSGDGRLKRRMASICHAQKDSNDNHGDANTTKLESLFEKVVDDVDYYSLLGVDRDASAAEIKAAYREMAKCCHPDIVGARGEELCTLLNECYRVLSEERETYDEELAWEEEVEDGSIGNLLQDGYTGLPLSRWCGPGHKMTKADDIADANDAVFVDEISCIGCKNCLFCAEATFRIEPEFGRARARTQWLNTREEIDIAIDSCPVDCIHWVKREELPGLEFVMRNILQRVDVGIMMAGQGGGIGNADVFEETAIYMSQRQQQEMDRDERRRTSKEERRKRQAAAMDIQHQAAKWNSSEGMKDVFQNVFGGAAHRGRRKAPQRTAWQEEFNRACQEEEEEEEENSNAAAAAAAAAEQQEEYVGVPLERALVPVRVYNNADFARSFFENIDPKTGRRCR